MGYKEYDPVGRACPRAESLSDRRTIQALFKILVEVYVSSDLVNESCKIPR